MLCRKEPDAVDKFVYISQSNEQYLVNKPKKSIVSLKDKRPKFGI